MQTLTFLTLLAGLDNQKLIPPRQSTPPRGSGEDQGVLPPPLQQLHSMVTATTREMERKSLDYSHSDDPVEREQLMPILMELESRARVLNKLFWYEIRSHFGVITAEQIYIDHNWHCWVMEDDNCSGQCSCPVCSLERMFRDGGKLRPEDPTFVN